MTLTPQAAALVEAAAAARPVEMHMTDVQTLRASVAERMQPSTTPIHETGDLVVPTPAGGVPVRRYRPSGASDLPVLMWMHGGGFAIGDLDMSDDYLRRLSIGARVVIVSVDYRLAPENPFPCGLDDCLAVWNWLQSGPSEVPADGTRLAVGGESAGGTLALALAQRLRDEGGRIPDAVVTAYGSAEMRVSNPDLSTPLLPAGACPWFWDMYAPDASTRRDPYCNPAAATSFAGLGPTLVITAGFDVTRDATEEYARRLEAAGVAATLSRYEGVPHGFLTMLGALPEAKSSFDEIVQFLGANLGGARHA